ncbi:MAG TPA: hypothetical protein VFZ93_14235 [Albitalea sp.]
MTNVFPSPAATWPGAPWVALARRSAHAQFDACRALHAAAVQNGLAERSLLASAAFERRLAALERLALGAWARTR